MGLEVMDEKKNSTTPVPFNVFVKFTKKVFLDIYGEERVDFEILNDNLPTLLVTVHFPHIKIENETGQTYDIFDMFIRFSFGLIETTISGLKTTFLDTDFLETQTIYIHSHIKSSNFIRFSQMCLGRTYFRDTIDNFERYNRYKLMELPYILHTFNNIIKVESLEGIPYVHMESCNSVNFYNKKSLLLSPMELKSIAIKVLSKIKQFNYTIDGNGNVKIEKVEDILKTLRLPYKYKARLINGIRYSRAKPQNRLLKSYKNYGIVGIDNFTFKGKHIPYKIIDNPSKLFNIPLVIDPHLVEQIKTFLELEFFKFLTSNYKKNEIN